MENKSTRNFIDCNEEDYLSNKNNYMRYIGRVYEIRDVEVMTMILKKTFDIDFKCAKRDRVNIDNVKEMKFDKIIPYNNSTAKDNIAYHFNIIFPKELKIKGVVFTARMGEFEEIMNANFSNIKLKNNANRSVTYQVNPPEQHRDTSYINYKNREIKYPISIVSYKRANDEGTTHKFLTKLKIEHYLFIEDQEYTDYKNWYDPKYCEIIVRPNHSKEGMGSTPMRNEIIDYWGKKHKFERVWILDDNIQGYKRFNNGFKVDIESHIIFTSIEKHIEQIKNAGIVSHNLQSFITEGDYRKCVVSNTKCYSSMLIPTFKFRFNHKYNEDVLISIENINDDNLITLCYNHILYDKKTSGTQTGGNQEELYSGEDGYKNKYEYLYNTLEQLILDGDVELKNGKKLDDLIKCKSLKSKQYHHSVNYSVIKNSDVAIEWVDDDEWILH